MQKKTSTTIIILLLIIIGLLTYNSFFNKKSTDKDKTEQIIPVDPPAQDLSEPSIPNVKEYQKQSIEALTKESVVVAYVKKYGKLPQYYITKSEAKTYGWNASEGNLCDVLPNHAIGGDIFTNREKSLPTQKGRIWYEADLNYNCGHRNADRLLFSSDGLIYVTHDHYKTFEQK